MPRNYTEHNLIEFQTSFPDDDSCAKHLARRAERNLGLLRRDPPGPPEERTDILADMVDESDRLIRLVNDLMLLARADAGRSLAFEPITIQPVIDETIRQVKLIDDRRQIKIDISSGLEIQGDSDAFKQVLLILLDNALKHSEGEVGVAAGLKGSWVEIRVQDHGAGIPPEVMPHVFMGGP